MTNGQATERSGSRNRSGVWLLRPDVATLHSAPSTPHSAPATLHSALCTLFCLCVLLAACPGAAADHSRLGDDAVLQGDYTTAVAEYRAGLQSNARPELYAKLGQAALHLKNYREAAEAYRHLGESDPSRVGEAAAGLERVARAAQQSSDALALREALLALRALTPERPAGRFAVSLALTGRLQPAEALSIMPYALAGATTDRQTDSLLVLFADAQRETTACEEAIRMYQTLIRRAGERSAPEPAVRGLAGCAVRLGLDATDLNQPEIAERWFRTALDAGGGPDLQRQALLGLGDARLDQGDSLEAASLFRRALELGSASDSLGEAATQRLRRLLPDLPQADTADMRTF